MSFLVRKINKAKWHKIDIMTSNDVTADTITNCLKTTQDRLSVWFIQTEADLDKAILAIVANQDHLDTIDVVILDEPSLIGCGLSIIASPGDTPVKSLVAAHRDIEKLTFTKLGQVKDHIVQKIRAEKLKRYTVNTLKKILTDAITAGLLVKEDLKESLQRKI